MQLRRLEVENIRSYERGQLDVAPGTTLIVGDVGAGKTSLLYAVEMALFGVAEVDAAYLVRHGALHAEVAVRFEDGEHVYEVARRFRRVRRKGRDQFETEKISFREDGRETSYSATEVRQRVIELLGFPDNPNPQAHSDLWRWAIYVPQEKMREILSARPQERLETVRKALGVERFRTAAENAQELGADLRASARHRRESAERLAHHDLEFADASAAADRLRLERPEHERAIAAAAAEHDHARARLADAERAALQVESTRRELEALRQEEAADASARRELTERSAQRATEIERRQRELDAARSTAAEGPRRAAAVRDAEEALRSAQDEWERRAEGLRQLTVAREQLRAADARLADASDRAKRGRRETELVRAELDAALAEGPGREPPAPTPTTVPELEARLDRLRTGERAALETVASTAHSVSEVETLLREGVCPRCHQAVRSAEFEPQRTVARASHTDAEAALHRIGRSIADAEAERKARERYERAHERWTALEQRRAGLRETLRRRTEEEEQARSAVVESTALVAAAREAAAALEGEEIAGEKARAGVALAEAGLTAARQAAEQATLAGERARAAEEALGGLAAERAREERDLARWEERARVRTEKRRSLEETIAAGTSAETVRSQARADLETAESRWATEREALVRADTRLDAEVRRIAGAERGRAERAALVAEAVDLEQKAAWVSGPFRVAVLSMEQELLAHAQGTFDRVFARYFASLVDDPALIARTDVGFTPEVLIDGAPTPAEALSGGERTALALAFRLALAHVVRSLGEVRLETLLLDEPTDGFSAEQVVRMGELLGELALPQVVIVSHEGQLAAVADRTVRVRKVDGRAILEADAPAAGPTMIDGSPSRKRRTVGTQLPASSP